MSFHQKKKILIGTVIKLFQAVDVSLKQEVFRVLSRVIDIVLRLVESNDIVVQAFFKNIDYRVACNRLLGFKTDQQVFDIAVSSLERLFF